RRCRARGVAQSAAGRRPCAASGRGTCQPRTDAVSVRHESTGEMSKYSAPYVMVTGGAGFIGTNLSDQLLSEGETVRILDNLSRRGVEENLGWLRSRHGDRVQHVDVDIRDA